MHRSEPVESEGSSPAALTETMIGSTLELFATICDDTAAGLAATTDWSETGRRAGQYRVDLDLDARCVQPLLAAGFTVLSEETGIVRPAPGAPDTAGAVTLPVAPGERVVVVDPLDGSTNASLGLPWCATALCLVVDGVAEVAMVTNLRTGERFEAVRGRGARRHPGRSGVVAAESVGESVSGDEGSFGTAGNAALRVGPEPTTNISDAIIATSGLFPSHWGWRQYRALGAAALDICTVARGALDGFVDVDDDAHGVWDYLAAVLVLTEAGGVAADAHGRDLLVLDPTERRTPVCATSASLLDTLIEQRTGN